MDSGKKLSGVTIGLHWLVAICILSLIAIGIYMVKTESWHLYHLHKSIGSLVFAAIIVRVVWRLKNGLPEPVRQFSKFEHLASNTVHYLLLICTVAMPVTGMIYSGASGHGFGIFNLAIFPSNYSMDNPGQAIPFNAQLSDLAQSMHGTIGYFLIVLIAIHLAGALKHHILDKDQTLKRMLGFKLKDGNY